MKIVLLAIGKTNEQYLIEGISQYQKRLQHYIQFEILEIPNIKNINNISNIELMKKEGALILKKIHPSDYLVLLDDKGKSFTSLKFSEKLLFCDIEKITFFLSSFEIVGLKIISLKSGLSFNS